MKLSQWLISSQLILINFWFYSPNLAKANTPNQTAEQFSLETFSRKTKSDRQWGRPPTRTSGGSRSACEEQLIALIPGKDNVEIAECQGESLSFMTATISPNPTIWVYIPPSLAAKTAELVVLDEQQRPLSVQLINLPQNSGIAGFKLDSPLENNLGYRWQLSVVVNPQNPAQNPTVEGLITRIEPSQSLSTELKTSTQLETAHLYAKAGIWHDTLTSLADLRCENPTDRAANDWLSLLDLAGLKAISLSPIVNCPSNLKPITQQNIG